MPETLWSDVTRRRENRVSIPPLDRLVLPRPPLLRPALASSRVVLAGPPEVGKTTVANLLAYLTALATEDPLAPGVTLTIQGVFECARGVDLLLDASFSHDVRLVIFETPFDGDGPGANPLLVDGLRQLRERRPELRVLVTTRPGSFVDLQHEFDELDYFTTPMRFADWYDPKDLVAHGRRFGVSLPETLAAELGCPARVERYAVSDLHPPSPAERQELAHRYRGHTDEATLDKIRILESHDDLRHLAVLLRLQEYATTLPSVKEISNVLGQPVHDLLHHELIATIYDFDGENRLRFEHATAREATDELMKASRPVDAQSLGLSEATGDDHWLKRALRLWSTEVSIHERDWDAIAGVPEIVLAELAPHFVAVAATHRDPRPLELLEPLDLDAWGTLDVAYELVSSWLSLSDVPAADDLVQVLVSNRASDGAYAVLEALLYIRSPEVGDLWPRVNDVFGRLARDGDRLNRELLLAIDALAWRPPPRDIGQPRWIDRTIDALQPANDSWGLVRFLAGYHPEGTSGLSATTSLEEKLEVDRGVIWTDAHAALAAFLVQWHFVHQSRARAILARQPRLNQEFLFRSFHEAPVSDRDAPTARLIESMAAAGGEIAGWGFFLSENLRAVSPDAYGPKTRAAAQRSLAVADPESTGVAAAAMTYVPDPAVAPAVREHFSDVDAGAHLLDALVDGLLVLGQRLLEPRFTFRRALASIYDTCGWSWPDLKEFLPGAHLLDGAGKFDVDGLIRRLDLAAADLGIADNDHDAALVAEVQRRVRRGDLRPLMPHPQRLAPGRADELAKYRNLLQSAVANLQDKTLPKLPFSR